MLRYPNNNNIHARQNKNFNVNNALIGLFSLTEKSVTYREDTIIVQYQYAGRARVGQGRSPAALSLKHCNASESPLHFKLLSSCNLYVGIA